MVDIFPKAYTGTTFCSVPPHMIVVAMQQGHLLMEAVHERLTDRPDQTILRFPGRELVQCLDKLESGEYLYTAHSDMLFLSLGAKNILAERIGRKTADKAKISSIMRDSSGRLVTAHESIVCSAILKGSDLPNQPSNIRVGPEDLRDQAMFTLATMKAFQTTRQQTFWVSLPQLVEALQRFDHAAPFMEKPGMYSFGLHNNKLIPKLPAKQIFVDTPSVSLLQAFLARTPEAHKVITNTTPIKFITPKDIQRLSAASAPSPSLAS